MVYAQLLKDIVEIGTTTLVFAETFQYTAKGIMYPRLKSDLEKLVESGEMNREEANYRLRICELPRVSPAGSTRGVWLRTV